MEDKILKRIAELEELKNKWVANAQACVAAIAELQNLIAKEEPAKPEEEKK